MKKAPIPVDDEERIKALKTYGILDTLPEKEYDDLTQLASYICQTPISLITLVDETRQVFKSSFGIEATANSREYGFCAHGITTKEEYFIINDTEKDDRFHDHPMVTGEPHIGFYAGFPLFDQQGFVLGTLCVIDNKPRVLSGEQIKALKALSNQVVKLMELRKTNKILLELQQKAERFAAQMEEFAYVTSHDLKEPLRTVSLMMQLLKKDYEKQLDERAGKLMTFATDATKRMTLLINELLVYAKVDELNKQIEMVDIFDLLQEVKDLHTGILEEKDAVLNFGPMPVVQSSKTALKIVFQNLIGNALKYQADGTKPIVNVSSEDVETYWQFSIEDNGLGIAKEYHDRIFKIFKRLHTREKYEGTGMGLATCKKIVEGYGGSIWVESEENKGSTFYFTILKPLL